MIDVTLSKKERHVWKHGKRRSVSFIMFMQIPVNFNHIIYTNDSLMQYLLGILLVTVS